MLDSIKLPGLPSLDKIINQNPLAQALGNAGTKAMGVDDRVSTDEKTYDALVHYFKYASTAYAIILPGPDLIKPRPNGQKLVGKLFDLLTDSHGYVARDDKRKEIVVAFRGSVSPTNFFVDFMFAQKDWDSTYVQAPPGTKVHQGFQAVWKAVAADAMKIVAAEATAHPDYSIVVSGHSLGGAMASIAAITMKQSYGTSKQVRLYTYGQPRTGNDVFAQWVNATIGPENQFRVVHSLDGVPTMVNPALGYMHHGVEYWALSPHSPATTKICNGSWPLEDPSGSMKIPSSGINPSHLSYFGIFYMTPYLI